MFLFRRYMTLLFTSEINLRSKVFSNLRKANLASFPHCLNRELRAFSCKTLLTIFTLILTLAASGQSSEYELVRTPQNVAVNRTLPKDILSPEEAMPANFSKDPTDDEIFRVHFFEEPLVPTNIQAERGENLALVYALAGFSQRTSPDDFTTVLRFLEEYPKSRWRGSLLASLGLVYRRSGYYNQAMEAWQEAWDLLKNQKEASVKVLADRVLSELLMMNVWVGRVDKMDSLTKEIGQRTFEGPASERMTLLRGALAIMKDDPRYSFKCGPYALNRLFALKDTAHKSSEKLMQVESTSQGFTITQLEQMSRDVGLNYQMAFRNLGAVIIPNSIVHWKLGHYSTLLNVDSGGYYKCEDATMGTTYGQEFWLSPVAMDSSASGYFLVPQGVLPNGWRNVAAEEGSRIFGKGWQLIDLGKNITWANIQVGGSGNMCTSSSPMAQSNVHASAVSLHIFDRPLYHKPPKGPAILFDVDYHQKDTYQPANFSYSSLGPKWTFRYLSYVQDNPANQIANADVYMMGGGARTFTSFNSATQSYAPELQSNDVLVRVCPTCYELRHPDGSKEIYARPDGNTSAGRKIFLTQIVDVAGNAVTVSYDRDRLRIVSLQDALGQVTTISYENPNALYRITKVTDPFGRMATFDYDGQGRLIRIKDMIGIVSSFTYADGDFIDRMTTPYGTTSFIKQVGGDGYSGSLESHYPLGEKERIEYREGASGISSRETILPTPNNQFFNEYLQYRNTFFWDKKAMQEAPGNYKNAKLYHWLHGSPQVGESGYAAPMLESIKEPFENRVWFAYQNQADAVRANQGMSAQPSVVGRVLDDGTSQFSRFTYNLLGKITSAIDPVGRRLTYSYDTSNINLLEIRQTTGTSNDLLARYTYNNQHLPLTSRDASGLLTVYTYNTAGQLLTVTNPKKETTTFTYDGNGYLKSATGPVAGTTVNFGYDGFGRVRTVTDPEGYTVTTDYDALDRPTVITYPDSSFEQIAYNRLDAVYRKDRLGRESYTTYDSLDRLTSVKDPLGRVTKYSWCNCGSLSQIIDPLNHATNFIYDVQGRLTAKKYHDGKAISYTYEKTTSRLKEVTDQKGQKTQYSYFIDGNIRQIDYPNASIATPSVSYTYDPRYNRVTSMSDATGRTDYTYHPVLNLPLLGTGSLASVDGPLVNDIIQYGYDSLGRASSRSINGVVSSVSFDVLGRLTSATNVLGKFDYNYVNQTGRLSSIAIPNGLSTVFDYFDNKGDQRLKQIWNRTTYGNTLSKHDYEYNAEAQITKWTKQSSGNPPKPLSFAYDAADQLISVTQQDSKLPVAIQHYAYRYDSASNRLAEQAANNVTLSEYNSLNQLIRQWNPDSVRQAGNFPVTGNPGANAYRNGLVYDDNGNTLSASSPSVSYDWDAADRLVRIMQGTDIIEFVYDGLSRRIAEKRNGVVTKRWLWDGMELVEERDPGGSAVTKRFFSQGEQINGVNYYFTIDHLGSVREMTDGNGVVQARYDYDPYGRRTRVLGKVDADFGFSGHYFHAASGLYLALYRVYDAKLGRWLNRDPLEEEGGLNLYGYVSGNPVNLIDRYGLCDNPCDNISNAVSDAAKFLGQQTGDAGAARDRYNNAASKLSPSDKEARNVIKAASRAETPILVRKIIELKRPGLGPLKGSGGTANVTNPSVNLLGKVFKYGGRTIFVAAIAYDVYNVINSPCQSKASFEFAFGTLGSIGGGAMGAFIGIPSGPGLVVVSIGGAAAGGAAGRMLGSNIYDIFYGE